MTEKILSKEGPIKEQPEPPEFDAPTLVTYELFKPPPTLKELNPNLWKDPYFYLPHAFTKRIANHEYVIEVSLRYMPLKQKRVDDRTYYDMDYHATFAGEAGLFKVRGERVGMEYYIANYKFLDPPDEEIDGDVDEHTEKKKSDEPSSNQVVGEDVSKVEERLLVGCIEDRLLVHIIYIYEKYTGRETLLTKNDKRKLKFGTFFYSII